MTYRLPFTERKTFWRGLLDLSTGCYPAFLFGGSLGKLLPVFHFHDVTPAYLEPYLRYLAENQYRTVVSDDIHHMLKTGVHTGPRTVALCFDDAWASIWTVVYPMLRQYNLTAITYAIPARVPDAAAPRPLPSAASSSADGPPHATWPELQELLSSGVVDVQAHTLTHAMIFCDNRPAGFVTPAYAPPALAEPLLNDAAPPEFLSAADLGAPIYPCRSRCSDASRFYPDPNGIAACRAYVTDNGGADYCKRLEWEKPLYDIMRRAGGRWETAEETQRAIVREVADAREILNARLKTDTVRHLCFPWAVAGRIAEASARRAGYLTAFADSLFGKRAVRAGDNPYRLMRLKHQYIYALPGNPRRHFFQLGRRKRNSANNLGNKKS
jgi:hypothetical protein